jgi:hypothetical protein
MSEGILEGAVPMVRPGLKKNMVGIPKINAFLDKTEEWRTSRECLH